MGSIAHLKSNAKKVVFKFRLNIRNDNDSIVLHKAMPKTQTLAHQKNMNYNMHLISEMAKVNLITRAFSNGNAIHDPT